MTIPAPIACSYPDCRQTARGRVAAPVLLDPDLRGQHAFAIVRPVGTDLTKGSPVLRGPHSSRGRPDAPRSGRPMSPLATPGRPTEPAWPCSGGPRPRIALCLPATPRLLSPG